MSTRELARGLGLLNARGLPEHVRAEVTRALVNVVGVSIGASGYEAVDIIVATGLQHGGDERSSPVPGRSERLDAMTAALATGSAAHLDDFDDTHLATVVHPTAAVFAAALPVVAGHDVAGVRLIDAVALGVETQLRVAIAMTPWHYDAGWHITGTVGSLGAAVTAGLLNGLDEDGLTHALAIASSLSLGHREGFGTMVKPFHPGKAASNGLLAAGLAAQGFTGSPTALEGPRGYFTSLSPQVDLPRLVEGLGERWELLDNTYKPYPCGIVCHPAIEAAERLYPAMRGSRPVAVRVHCHPLVVELTGNPTPRTGLEARFSTIHGVAAGLTDGTVGLAQYDEARVLAQDLVDIRALTTLVPDEASARAAARVEVDLDDGRVVSESVTAARGSLERPLTDDELDDKVTRLVEPAMPGRAGEVVDATRSLRSLESCLPLLAAITPENR